MSHFCSVRWIIIILIIPIAIAVLCALILQWVAEPPVLSSVIQTLDGPVQGSQALSRDGKKYWRFLGIPYATPPTGNRKFLPPTPMKPWKDVKKVVEWSPVCAQFDGMFTRRVLGQLDCLYLNVFVSQGGKSSKPVLVWIHGGGFSSGSSKMYQPDYLMDNDIIVVVMNYRLGAFGFLNLEAGSNYPQGNMGMLDQQMALKWVQKNIAQFGGNPNKVTIFGESAGAVATHLHLLSPMSKGLFQRAIVQSSPALSPWSFTRKPFQLAKNYAKKLGCEVDSVESIYKCFNEMDIATLVKNQESLNEPLTIKDMFEPSIDGRFLTDTPQNLLKSGQFLDIPIMFGVNPSEGGMRTARFEANPELIPKLDKEWAEVLHNSLIVDDPIARQTAMEIRTHYFGNRKFLEDLDGFMQNLTDMHTDSGFFWPVHKSAVSHAKKGAPTYLYYFNYTSKNMPGTYSFMRATRRDDWLPGIVKVLGKLVLDWVDEYWLGGKGSRPFGVMHGEDGFQIWNIDGVLKYMVKKDTEFSRDFIKALVDFADGVTPLKFRNVDWPSVNMHLSSGQNEYKIPFMLMDNESKPRVIAEPFSDRIKFWSKLKNYDY